MEWALAKDPAQRPHSATAFAFALTGPPPATRVAGSAAARRDAPPRSAAEPESGTQPDAERDAPQPVAVREDTRPQRRPRRLLPVLGGVLALVAVTVALAGVAVALSGGRARQTAAIAGTAPAAGRTATVGMSPAPAVATSAALSPSTPSPTPSPTPAPALTVSNVRVENAAAWARGRGDLNVCFDAANARSGSTVRVLLTRGAALDQGIAEVLVPLAAGQVNTCAALPHGGMQPAGPVRANVLDAEGKPLGPPALFTAPPPLGAANANFGDPQQWGLDNQPLQACADVHEAQNGDAVVLRVLTADGQYVGQSDPLPLSTGDAPHSCLTIAVAGRQPANSYLAVLYAVYGETWSELQRSDPFTIAPPPTPTPTPAPRSAAPAPRPASQPRVSQPQAAPAPRQAAPTVQPAPAPALAPGQSMNVTVDLNVPATTPAQPTRSQPAVPQPAQTVRCGGVIQELAPGVTIVSSGCGTPSPAQPR